MNRFIFVSIVTTDYLARAVVLHRSLRAVYGDEVELVVLHVGESATLPAVNLNGLTILNPEDLALPIFWDMAFRYEKGALVNALKPFLLAHVLREKRARSVILLDADTLVYSRFDEAHALLDSEGASVLLTPHFDRPQVRVREPHDIDLLRHGVMNGGFIAVSATPPAHAFLDWWSSHLETECRYDIERGYYGDQHWLDLVPALFDGVHILRHRGYNAAYWNYPDRAPHGHAGAWRIDKAPLRFFHFSQWRMEQGQSAEDYMDKAFLSRDESLRRILVDYHDRWQEARSELPSGDAAYPFDRFMSGAPISPIVREVYAETAPSRAATREELFGRGIGPLMQPSADVPAFRGIEMPALYVLIRRRRRDLHHFELLSRAGQIAFLRWILTHAPQDHGLDESMLAPARQALEGEEEISRSLEALHDRIAAAHERVRTDAAQLPELAGEVAALIRALAGVNERIRELDATRVSSLFRAATLLQPALITQLSETEVAQLFAEIESHGRYVATRNECEYEAWLESGPASPEPMLDADAIRNLGAVLLGLLHRLLVAGSEEAYEAFGRFVPSAEPAYTERPAEPSGPRETPQPRARELT